MIKGLLLSLAMTADLTVGATAYYPTPAQRRPNTAGFVFTACQPKK